MKYKGVYRVKANIDETTNDFPRNKSGSIETDDLYIKCAYGNQIYHYGRSILVAYIPSIGRGHNILRGLAEELCGIENSKENDAVKIPFEELYGALLKEGTIKDIKEYDEEIEFKFNAKDIELIAKYLKPQTGGADISPFSTKNLPKQNYVIPDSDLSSYQDTIKDVAKEDILVISHITRSFISNKLAKSKLYKSKDIKAEMRKSMLKGKEFIHYSGYWKQYLDYLKKELHKE
jgi:hypothetical protein